MRKKSSSTTNILKSEVASTLSKLFLSTGISTTTPRKSLMNCSLFLNLSNNRKQKTTKKMSVSYWKVLPLINRVNSSRWTCSHLQNQKHSSNLDQWVWGKRRWFYKRNGTKNKSIRITCRSGEARSWPNKKILIVPTTKNILANLWLSLTLIGTNYCCQRGFLRYSYLRSEHFNSNSMRLSTRTKRKVLSQNTVSLKTTTLPYEKWPSKNTQK